MKNKTVMPKISAPVERTSPATAAANSAAGTGVDASILSGSLGWGLLGIYSPFAGDDAE
jgi:prenylated cyclic peptide (anacyclamide/piricyclamide family)